MYSSKNVKIGCLIIGIIILTSLCFYLFNPQNSKDVKPADIQNEQAVRDDAANKNKPVSDEDVNPVQKCYTDYLEKDVNNFIANAKTSENNDLEFSKLHMKFNKAADILNEKYAENIDIHDAYYKNNWVKLPCVEGTYFYAVNSEYLLDNYGSYLSDAYKEWLSFILKRESVMQDGGLAVPPDKLREYIVFLEKFVEQYPDFVLISDAKVILNSYLMTYLEGLDNSPIFDKWNTRKMLPEFKESYEKFLSENKDSKYYPMVEEFYNKSKENNFSWDRNFNQWLYEYHKKYFAD